MSNLTQPRKTNIDPGCLFSGTFCRAPSALIVNAMWTTSNRNRQSPNVPQNGNTYGMSSPISTAPPTEEDKISSRELEETLEKIDAKESEEEFHYRMEILARLNELVREWIFEISLAKQIPHDEAILVGGKIYTFGSYRLGVHSKGADIDALCVAPRHIDRAEYFTSFLEKLRSCPEVTELRAVDSAYVPVLKMCFGGIEIDLLFARLAFKTIPEDLNLQDDIILKNLHVSCVRSLNGCRVTDEILRLVPNIDVFRAALRAIRLWAKRYSIYSNILGYLGGVSWAMLVVRVCQLWPNAAASTIVHKFFQTFSIWEWPLPVLLKQTVEPSNLDFPVWNPKKNPADRNHLMPIITPCYPQQNSTYNVTKSTRTIMCRALNDGFRISEEIFSGRVKWELLFERPNFFMKYKHFLLVIASSATKNDHLEWYGLVESKLRQLVSMLERNTVIELVHINTEIFKLKERKDEEGNDVPNSVWVVGLEFHKIISASIDLTKDTQDFKFAVMKHAHATKMFKEKMNIEVKYVKRKGLREFLDDENIIKRDRSAAEIMASIPENSATIMLRKRTLEENNSSTNAANAARVNRNPFRKVNNNTPDAKSSKPSNVETPVTASPEAVPETPASRSSSESPTTTNNGANSASPSRSPPEDEIIDLSSSSEDEIETEAVVIEDEEEDDDSSPPAIRRRKLSPGNNGQVPTPPEVTEIIDLSDESSDAEL